MRIVVPTQSCALEQVVHHGLADDADLGGGVDVGGGEIIALFDLPVADRQVVGIDADQISSGDQFWFPAMIWARAFTIGEAASTVCTRRRKKCN